MRLNIVTLTIIALTIASCDVGVNNKKSSTTNNNSQATATATATATTTATGCFATGTGSSSTNYYSFQVTGRGRVEPNDIGWQSSMVPTYRNYTSTESDYFLDQFKTDGRFNIRVVARSSPGRTSPDDGTKGNLSTDSLAEYGCSAAYRNYTKLQLKVRVKAPNSSYYQDHIFDSIPVDGCSAVKEFSIPATNDPINIQIMSVNWDYDCIDYTNRGFPGHPNACPWHYVNINSCYRIEVQLATSYTKDIPR